MVLKGQYREVGDDHIPTSFNIFQLPYAEFDANKSLQWITYVADEELRFSPQDSGYYMNVYPLIAWHKRKRVLIKDANDGLDGRVRIVKHLQLSKKHKPARALAKIQI